jgi:hypothetical protein
MQAAVIEKNTTRSKQFAKFTHTLPLAKHHEEKANFKSSWETAIAEGAVTVDEFTDELRTRIEKWTDDNA